jgi:phosphonate metabolism-associated iron-containing alcohol dehydrogenase
LLSTSLIDTVMIPDGLPSLTTAMGVSERVWQALAPFDKPVIVAFGGGACLDIAKAASHRPVSGATRSLVRWLRGEAAQPALRRIPLIAVPTTAGTGSEVTRWATLWDVDADPARKLSLESAQAYPETALVDPQCCLTCPESVTRDSGLDALAHALEALWNRHATPLTDTLALTAARNIIETLPRVLATPDDLTLRHTMSTAALQAGLAFSHTRTALAHALSYDLTLQENMPHGLACAVWLPQVWRLAHGKESGRDRLLAQVFGDGVDGPVELEHWLARLGVDCSGFSVDHAANQRRIASAQNHIRGKNFIGSAP